MILLLNSTKTMDLTVDVPRRLKSTEPVHLDTARQLAGPLARISLARLETLMGVKGKLADRTRADLALWGAEGRARRPALLAFTGLVYKYLDAPTLTAAQWKRAQSRLRILSGLYGLLRPTDGIEPHRLEMGSRLKNPRGKNLYDWWGPQIADALNAQAEAVGTDVLVNCASEEYFGAVDRDALKLRVITPVFKEMRQGTPKIVSFFAKKARGSMARFIIQRRLTDVDALKEFDLGGYRYQPEMSEGDRLVFLRDGKS